LYLASKGALPQAVQSTTGQTLLVVGQSLNIWAFVYKFLNSNKDRNWFAYYPTGATFVAKLSLHEWNQLSEIYDHRVNFLFQPIWHQKLLHSLQLMP